MFLRYTNRKKDGKEHRYYSVVENRRLSTGKMAQRTVLYLGEINDSQQAAWLKTLDVFDEDEQRNRELSLFPDDRENPGRSRRQPAGEVERAGTAPAARIRATAGWR